MSRDLGLIGIVIATLALMIIPLNQNLLDIFLTVNISLSILLLLVAIYLRRPSDFSTFPSVILIGTSFRLAISVGTTRSILSEADAGTIIETFGNFVVGGSIAIGLVVFLIITVVQFLVITKGAERVAEVGARFTLDALPGKQMSIDAEVRAGNMEPDEAARQRKQLGIDSQFFGAMDGAMKFIKGDSIAGLIIICINLIGGVSVGISLHGYSFSESIAVFSLLTIGDGLVAQLPALLMSLCAGIVVTRVNSADNENLGADISNELITNPKVLFMAAGIVLVVGLIPGFPLQFFAALSVLLILAGFLLQRTRVAAELLGRSAGEDGDSDTNEDSSGEEDPPSNRFRVQLGEDLAAMPGCMVDVERRLRIAFQELFFARGVQFPRPDIQLNPDIGAREFTIELDEVPVFRDMVPEGCILLTERFEEALPYFEGEITARCINPFLRGIWLKSEQEAQVSELGFATRPVASLISEIAFRYYESNLGSLFSVDIFEKFMALVRAHEPTTVGLIEEALTPADIQKLLRHLIEDGVPVRPLPLFINSVYHWIQKSNDLSAEILAEYIRGSMKRQICHSIAAQDGTLGLIMFDPTLEAMARVGAADSHLQQGGAGNESLVLKDDVIEKVTAQLRQLESQSKGKNVALIVSSDLRRRVRNFVNRRNIQIPVLASHEIAPEVTSYPLEMLTA